MVKYVVKEIVQHFWRTFNGGICVCLRSNRGDCNISGSRTDLVFQLPKLALYQTELRPDFAIVTYFNHYTAESQEEKARTLWRWHFLIVSDTNRKQRQQEVQGDNLDYLWRIVIIVIK